MKEIKWNSGMKATGIRPRLYFFRGLEYHRFAGVSIPGIATIIREIYTKNGKWSSTEYTIALASGVRFYEFVSPLHGVWGQDLTSWPEVARRLGVDVDTAQEIVRREYKLTAERLDAVHAAIEAMETENGEAETVYICFGSPTNRQIAEGYWDEPKSGHTSDGREISVRPGDAGWGEPECDDGEVVSSRHKPGFHGGSWTVEVIVGAKG